MNYMGKSNFLSRIDKTSKSHRHFEKQAKSQHRDSHSRCVLALKKSVLLQTVLFSFFKKNKCINYIW